MARELSESGRKLIEKEDQKSSWLLELIGAVASGLFIGYERQRLADSGAIYRDKIVLSILMAVGSYVIAFIMLAGIRVSQKIPDWLSIAVLGSVFSAILRDFVYYLIRNLGNIREYGSVPLAVIDTAFGLLFIIPIYCLLALPIMGGLQLLQSVVRRAFR